MVSQKRALLILAWKRCGSFCISAVSFVLASMVFTGVINIGMDGLISSDSMVWIIVYVVQAIVVAVFVFDATRKKATIGMKVMGLVVRDADGKPISGGRFLLRLSVGTLFMPILPISCLIFLFRAQSIADVICNTMVTSL